MFIKCLLFLTVISVLDILPVQSDLVFRPCLTPRLINGKVKSRQRSKLIKFMCTSGYELVGNRYSTCKNGQWDTPKPTCVKPGCLVPMLKNGLTIPSKHDAWVVFFCLPGYKLMGSSAIYCDGRRWNATAPTCVDSKVPTTLSCDFENNDLCGWSQDTAHDFDWERLNKKTPSSFLLTGPSYDHTYGPGKNGYYMYIESSSRVENDSARLISPIYDAALAKDGCFSFYYHMYGKDIGGLRVFQKPDSLSLLLLLNLPSQLTQKYLLFEQWGNQGDVWYGDVSQLKDFSDNFQIVIEGIRGKKFTSDIAIDDVAILQGENCTLVRKEMTTPQSFSLDSCEGRCYNTTATSASSCDCHDSCILGDNCCADFLELCVYGAPDYTTDDSNQITKQAELPQTQKLVANNTTPISAPPPSPQPIPPSPRPKPLSPRPVPSLPPVMKTPKSVRTSPMTTVSTPKPRMVTTKPVIFQKDAIKENVTSTPYRPINTTPKIVPVKPAVKPVIKPTSKPATNPRLATNATVTSNRTVVQKMTSTVTTIIRTTKASLNTKAVKSSEKGKKSKENVSQETTENSGKSSAWKPVLITLLVLFCGCGLVGVALWARGARGRFSLAYVRGRTTQHSEVRYLHSDVDDEIQ